MMIVTMPVWMLYHRYHRHAQILKYNIKIYLKEKEAFQKKTMKNIFFFYGKALNL